MYYFHHMISIIFELPITDLLFTTLLAFLRLTCHTTLTFILWARMVCRTPV